MFIGFGFNLYSMQVLVPLDPPAPGNSFSDGFSDGFG